MKFSYILLALIFAVSCQDTKKTTIKKSDATVEVADENADPEFEQVQGAASDEQVTVPNDGLLKCNFIGESEYGAPQNSVTVEINGSEQSVGKCDACESINKSTFGDYEIPSNAISACGGWWAGAGDYFYTIKNINGGIDVFVGWQDEGQLENDDTSFHWKRTKTFK